MELILAPPYFTTHGNTLFPELLENSSCDLLLSNSSNSTSSSDQSSSPIQEANSLSSNELIIEVNLQHRPRNSKGIWQNVTSNQRLRVTKDKGKRLRLEIKINYQNLNITEEQFYLFYKLENLQIQLFDIEKSLYTNAFSVESSKFTNNNGEIEIKLYKVLCRRLQFMVNIPDVSGKLLVGTSNEFGTHNSGTPSVPKEKKRIDCNLDEPCISDGVMKTNPILINKIPNNQGQPKKKKKFFKKS